MYIYIYIYIYIHMYIFIYIYICMYMTTRLVQRSWVFAIQEKNQESHEKCCVHNAYALYIYVHIHVLIYTYIYICIYIYTYMEYHVTRNAVLTTCTCTDSPVSRQARVNSHNAHAREYIIPILAHLNSPTTAAAHFEGRACGRPGKGIEID